ncbi:glyceraldehyde-3-phosphate:ferredoxin oxidoreductase [Thermococcus thioreducens]|uniref:Glyceraldehyde-3-phosphate ferredoxin oxidoreductase n=1 Tax=Thermococcus thioreducens TaxID=277988 RepID=A0A0Q2M5S4_9EURY|nr:glyceraldehyde-3-phosphate:ferredoxin oxidoreductase [Thermococcus thioreducens]ASJ13323.1 glyceraldehyde-3-phosphate:ferredoxin oxidoreductase [Thermococcus thioreducens]KQH83266.1 glyceraldehyde-3-phosphate:ferredoxin oxidoreductase [Thermococcus thioreducens]SEW22644.1 glyceraldehyde-3-phosphate ferredoxin oxidoreductase [Thermococcus thioreducens]
MRFTVLRINLNEGKVESEELERDGIYGVIDYGIEVHESLETHSLEPYDPQNVMVMGMGPFSGSTLPGAHRLMFFFRSPLYGTLFPSAMGGAAYTFKNVGIDFVAFEGKAEKPVVVLLYNDGENVRVELHAIELERVVEIWRGYKGEEGVYALTQYLIDTFGGRFDFEYRIAVVGPASLNTNYGAIFSQALRKGERLVGSEDWAARGGPGSVLLRAHNVVGIVFGGKPGRRSFPGEDIGSFKTSKSIVEGVHKKPYNEIIAEKTTKYRFNPKLNTGGTFGGNYPAEGDFVPILNWQMPYIEKEERIKIHENIMKHYWEPFNEEAIKPKNWTTCGEPCPVVCKKHRRGHHVEYEPYEANGPLSGSISLRASDISVHAADAMGFDAIEFGGTAAWVLELIHRGLLKPEEVGLSGKPEFTKEALLERPVEASEINAKLVAELAHRVAFAENEIARIIGLGKRKASVILDERFKDRLKYGESFKDYGVFVPLGENGEMTPTMYWAIGNYIPLPIQGRYWTFYQFGVFLEPEELAQKIIASALWEFWYDNVGWCRFHRGWMKPVLKALFMDAYGENVDMEEHAKKQIKRLIEYARKAGYTPVFWDSMRVIDLVSAGSEEFGNERWAEKFRIDKVGTAKEYLEKVLEAYSEALGVDWRL